MASADAKLERRLKETGKQLSLPHDSVDELLHVLDKVEKLLLRVDPSPKRSMLDALKPSMNALIKDSLSKHSDIDVKVAVASCISEITRITAPNAPYTDDQMRDVFELIVSSFEDLFDRSSRSYNKRASILETVSKVRSCVIMLDLECDELIVKMFDHFLKAVRDFHIDSVFSSMENIMELVIDESEEISVEILKPLLASVKKDRKGVLPVAHKLAKGVLLKSAEKLKPYMMPALTSLGESLDTYHKIVAAVCDVTTANIENKDDYDEPANECKSEKGGTAANALPGFITLFNDYFADGNFRLPATKFFLEVLDYYKFHISQLHPIGMIQIKHFEFLCRSMGINPIVNRFRVFYQLYCSLGFYSFQHRLQAKKILQSPLKSYHDWKQKKIYIKERVIPMKMVFRGAEDIPVESSPIPVQEAWYREIIPIPAIQLPERALVAAAMSLSWRYDRRDKPVYMEGDQRGALYIVAFERKGGKMVNVPLESAEPSLYSQILGNFALPRDENFYAPPAGSGALLNLDVGSDSKKKKRAGPGAGALKKSAPPKADVATGVRRPKPEPVDSADISAANPDSPIDLEFGPEPLRRKSGKRAPPPADVVAQPPKKVARTKTIGKRDSLDALEALLTLGEVPVFAASAAAAPVEDAFVPLPVSEATQALTTEGGEASAGAAEAHTVVDEAVVPEEKDVGAQELVFKDAPQGAGPEAQAAPEVDFGGSEGLSSEEGSPIHSDEISGDYYYRSYSEARAEEIHAPVWKLRQGERFSHWQACREWFRGAFPPAEVRARGEQNHEQRYRSYLQMAVSSASTTHQIIREWRNMHKDAEKLEAAKKEVAEERAQVNAQRKELRAEMAKFAEAQKTEEWSVLGLKKKVETATTKHATERKLWKKVCEREKNEKNSLRKEVVKMRAKMERLKKEKEDAQADRERIERKEEETKATLETAIKDLQAAQVEKAQLQRRYLEDAKKVVAEKKLADLAEQKLEDSEAARATTEKLVELLANSSLWMQERGVVNIANSILNSAELDGAVAKLMVAARHDGHAQGYAECAYHVTQTLDVAWDSSRAATRGVDTVVAYAQAKREYDRLQLPIMDLVSEALQHDDYVERLKDLFPEEAGDEE